MKKTTNRIYITPKGEFLKISNDIIFFKQGGHLFAYNILKNLDKYVYYFFFELLEFNKKIRNLEIENKKLISDYFYKGISRKKYNKIIWILSYLSQPKKF